MGKIRTDEDVMARILNAEVIDIALEGINSKITGYRLTMNGKSSRYPPCGDPLCRFDDNNDSFVTVSEIATVLHMENPSLEPAMIRHMVRREFIAKITKDTRQMMAPFGNDGFLEIACGLIGGTFGFMASSPIVKFIPKALVFAIVGGGIAIGLTALTYNETNNRTVKFDSDYLVKK